MKKERSPREKTPTPKSLPPTEMAKALVISEQELANLVRTGVLQRTTERQGSRLFVVYDWLATTQAYVLHLRKPADDARKQFMIEKSETQRIVRAHKELDLAKARGELIDGEHVDREVMNVLSSIKNHMRALPSRVSSLLLGLPTRQEIHALLKKYIDLTLREASDFDLMQLRTTRNGANGKHDRYTQRTKKRKARARR